MGHDHQHLVLLPAASRPRTTQPLALTIGLIEELALTIGLGLEEMVLVLVLLQ